MADQKQCSYVLPHELHGWEEQGVGPFGHRKYHVCSGMEDNPENREEQNR